MYPDVKPWISETLHEYWFSDLAPIWHSITTADKAVAARLRRIKSLGRKHRPALDALFDDASSVIERLATCTPLERCHSGSCPECVRAFQCFVVEDVLGLFEEEGFEEGDGVCVSVIDNYTYPFGSLKDLSIKGFQDRVKKVLADNGVEFAVGGFDISYNVRADGLAEPYWAPQLWLLMPKDNIEVWKPALKEAFPSRPLVNRPVKVLSWNQNPRALAYAIKADFNLRVSYEYTRKTADGVRTGQNSRNLPLRVPERLELFTFLNEVGLAARLFLLGVRPTRTNLGFTFVRLSDDDAISEIAESRPLEPQNASGKAQSRKHLRVID